MIGRASVDWSRLHGRLNQLVGWLLPCGDWGSPSWLVQISSLGWGTPWSDGGVHRWLVGNISWVVVLMVWLVGPLAGWSSPLIVWLCPCLFGRDSRQLKGPPPPWLLSIPLGRAVCQNSPHPGQDKGRARGKGEGGQISINVFFGSSHTALDTYWYKTFPTAQ